MAFDRDERDAWSRYRLLAMQRHPDKNGNTEAATQAFQELQNAYSVLKDSNERSWYLLPLSSLCPSCIQNRGLVIFTDAPVTTPVQVRLAPRELSSRLRPVLPRC